jgi:hypothetical protein
MFFPRTYACVVLAAMASSASGAGLYFVWSSALTWCSIFHGHRTKTQ